MQCGVCQSSVQAERRAEPHFLELILVVLLVRILTGSSPPLCCARFRVPAASLDLEATISFLRSRSHSAANPELCGSTAAQFKAESTSEFVVSWAPRSSRGCQLEEPSELLSTWCLETACQSENRGAVPT